MKDPVDYEAIEREFELDRIRNRIYWPVDARAARAFIRAYLRPAAGRVLPASDIYEALERFCGYCGVNTPSPHILGRELCAAGYEKVKKGCMVYVNIGFR